ncbi:MAG: 2-dehydropantoate 2-reductase [Cyclobacteriaceae bacterium]
MKSKTYIIGAGAIGKALAVALNVSGQQVELIRGSVLNKPTVKSSLKAIHHGEALEAEVPISTLDKYESLDGIVVITIKSFGNGILAERLRHKVGDTPVVLLQNGLGIEKPYLENHIKNLFRCILFVSSQIESDAVSYRPVRPSAIGQIAGTADLQSVVSQLNCQYFPFTEDQNIQEIIWKKAMANSVFNSICPLIEANNNIFSENEAAMKMAVSVVDECIGVAAKNGINLNIDEMKELILMMSSNSGGQYISTYQDIENGRQTEIDTLNLEIVRIAESIGMGEEVKITRLLGQLTKLKSELSMTG